MIREGILITDYLLNVGFPYSSIDKILSDKKLHLYKEESLLENIKNINNFFIDNGFTIKDIILMVERNAHIYSYKVETIIDKINYFNQLGYTVEQVYSMIKRCPQLCGLSKKNMDSKINVYKDKFNYKIILDLFFNTPRLFSYSMDSLDEKKNIFIEIGYPKDKIDKMFKIYPNLIIYRKESILKALNRFIANGYTKEEAIHITTVRPVLISNFTYEFSRLYNFFNKRGFSDYDIKKMTVKEPTIFYCTSNDLNIKINNLKEIGFSEENINNIIKIYPTIFTYDPFSIKLKMNTIIDCGYTIDEVINSITMMPSFIGFSIDSIKDRLNYLVQINLRDVFVLTPKHLIQSVEKTYARYEYLKSKGIDITMSNYIQLFIGEITFQNKYKVTKEDLISLYPMSKSISANKFNLKIFLEQFGYPVVYINRLMVYDEVKVMIDYLLGLGFNNKQIIRITTKYTQIFDYKNNIKMVMDNLKALGFNKDEIINIIDKFPNVLGLSGFVLNSIFNKINLFVNKIEITKCIFIKFPTLFCVDTNKIDLYIKLLEKYNYNSNDILNIIREYPNLFIMEEHTLNDKLNYLSMMNLLDIIILLPKLLSKNMELVYARYKYLESIGIFVNDDNFKILFQHEIPFSNKFGVTSDHVLKLLKSE